MSKLQLAANTGQSTRQLACATHTKDLPTEEAGSAESTKAVEVTAPAKFSARNGNAAQVWALEAWDDEEILYDAEWDDLLRSGK